MSNVAYEANPATARVEQTETPIDFKKVVYGINKLVKETVDKGRMETGDLVLDALFQGSLEEALSRNPYKSKSLEDLCKDPELLTDRRTLSKWVRAAALRRDLIANQVDCSKLYYSHLAALLAVTDEKSRRELAAEANQNEWSVRQISEKAASMKYGKAANGKAKELMKKMEDPLALLEDEETKRLLEDAQSLKEELESIERLTMVKFIDNVVARMLRSAELLRETKKNLVLIELDQLQPSQA